MSNVVVHVKSLWQEKVCPFYFFVSIL